MKKALLFPVLVALVSLLVLGAGCGGSDNGGAEGDGGGDAEAVRAEYARGFEEGETEGYAEGYADGREGTYEPGVPEETGADGPYAQGYGQGWAAGYGDGYDDAAKEASAPERELAEVEQAMLDFVRQNSAPGMEFRIENLVIEGDEAAGVVVCTSEALESPLIVMEKGGAGWTVVDFGTGIEPPDWYEY